MSRRGAVRQSSLALAVGVAAGLAGAFVLARFIVNLLYGVSASEPLAFIATALLLVAIGLLASYMQPRWIPWWHCITSEG